jgi:hypothetical protein
MKQALEFIIVNPPDTRTTRMSRLRNREDAITALRAAIAEQEKAEPVAVLQTDNSGRFLDCIYRGAATPADQFLWQEDKRIPRSTSIRLFTHPAPVPAGWQLVPGKDTNLLLERVYAGYSHGMNRQEGELGPLTLGQKNAVYAVVWSAVYATLAAAPKPGEMK